MLESEGNQDHSLDKFNRVDLLVEDAAGAALIIEVQYSYASHYLRRILFGAAKLITQYIEAGDAYNKVKKVISISLLYFPFSEMGQDDDYVYYGGPEFYGLHSGKRLSVRQDTLRSKPSAAQKQESHGQIIASKHNIFPEYYLIEVDRFPSEVKTALDEWIYFFKHSKIPDAFKSKHIDAAREKLRLMKMKPDMRRDYERFWMARASYQNEIDSAKEAGHATGLEEGHTQGQLDKQGQIARQMLENGEPLHKIVLYSGLTADEVAQLDPTGE